MRNREVTTGIALGQFQSPAFLPVKSNLSLIVYIKKKLKTLFEFLRSWRKKELLNSSRALIGKTLH